MKAKAEAERIYVKPGLKPGVKPEEATDADRLMVRDEYSKKPIPAAGAWVKLTRLVRRRLAAQDLVKADAPAGSAEPESVTASEAAPAAPESEPAGASESTGEQPAEASPEAGAEPEGTATRRRRRGPESEG